MTLFPQGVSVAGAGGPDDDGGPGGEGEAGQGAGVQGLQLQRQPAASLHQGGDGIFWSSLV